ncbi:MAG: CbiX/SirB N-terminal domain-containing protein [Proteobacteria bacterium]|nr:CbiX/SirB N-terminal domain-containing protein [Pseudomonadota bacterium]
MTSVPTPSRDTGLLLFAHGSRDAHWAEPFARLRDVVASRGVPAVLGYLERMSPDLAGAAAMLVAQGCRRIIVVPVFLGEGGHVRGDLPKLVAAAADAHPDIDFSLASAIGEHAAVIDAIADVCVAAARR